MKQIQEIERRLECLEHEIGPTATRLAELKMEYNELQHKFAALLHHLGLKIEENDNYFLWQKYKVVKEEDENRTTGT